DAHIDAFAGVSAQVLTPRVIADIDLDRQFERIDADVAIAAQNDRADVAGPDAIAFHQFEHGGDEFVAGEGDVGAINARGIDEALNVLDGTENGRSAGRGVAANAFEDRRAIVHNVRHYVDGRIIPVNELAVVPDFVRLLNGHKDSLSVFQGARERLGVPDSGANFRAGAGRSRVADTNELGEEDYLPFLNYSLGESARNPTNGARTGVGVPCCRPGDGGCGRGHITWIRDECHGRGESEASMLKMKFNFIFIFRRVPCTYLTESIPACSLRFETPFCSLALHSSRSRRQSLRFRIRQLPKQPNRWPAAIPAARFSIRWANASGCRGRS